MAENSPKDYVFPNTGLTLDYKGAGTMIPSPPPQVSKEAYGGDGWNGPILLSLAPFILWYIVRMVIKKFFEDRRDIQSDQSTLSLVKLLQEDTKKVRENEELLRTRLELITKERNDALFQLGKFTAQTEANGQKIEELKHTVIDMVRKIEAQTLLLEKVLEENAELKAKVSLFEITNSRLEIEISELKNYITINRVGR